MAFRFVLLIRRGVVVMRPPYPGVVQPDYSFRRILTQIRSLPERPNRQRWPLMKTKIHGINVQLKNPRDAPHNSRLSILFDRRQVALAVLGSRLGM
jgi:hypothetical protein